MNPFVPSPGFSVRLATPDDIPAVVALTREVAAEERWIATQPGFDEGDRARRLLATVTEGPGIMLVAEAANELIGTLNLIPAPYGAAELGMMVAREWRAQGVGRELLDAGIEWARNEPQVHKITLQHWPDNAAAHRLYLAAGFEVEGRLRRHYRRANEEIWDAIVMGLAVDDPQGS